MYLVLVRARDVHKVVRGFRRYGGRGGCRSRRRVLLFFALCVHCGPRLARGVPARPDRACGMLPAQARACVLQVEDAQKHPRASWLKYGLYMLAGACVPLLYFSGWSVHCVCARQESARARACALEHVVRKQGRELALGGTERAQRVHVCARRRMRRAHADIQRPVVVKLPARDLLAAQGLLAAHGWLMRRADIQRPVVVMLPAQGLPAAHGLLMRHAVSSYATCARVRAPGLRNTGSWRFSQSETERRMRKSSSSTMSACTKGMPLYRCLWGVNL